MTGLARASVICDLLDTTYQQPDLGNSQDPIAELIYIVLSTMTSEVNYQRSFTSLRERFPTWDRVVEAPVEEIEEAIRGGGLAPTKARLIQELLRRIRRDWGEIDLGFVHAWPTSEIRRYLCSLPGVGFKAATCVTAYSFGRDVCPVDTHTYRVAIRLGLLPLGTPEMGRRAHVALEQGLPVGQRLAFHINAIAHGRQRCQLERPRCDGCPLTDHCVAPEHGRYSRPLKVSAVDDTLNVDAQGQEAAPSVSGAEVAG
jgi:endonuclease-3